LRAWDSYLGVDETREIVGRIEQAVARFFADLGDHLQRRFSVALVPFEVEHGAQPAASIADIEPDLPRSRG